MSSSRGRALLAHAGWHLSPRRPHGVYTMLRESQWWPPERLEELQLDALRAVFEAAATIPFYRERGVDPLGLRSLDDLAAIPPLERGDLQRLGIGGLTGQGAKGQVHRTSGSVGRPVDVLWAPDLRVWSAALWRRFHYSLGVLPGERQLAVFTLDLPRGGIRTVARRVSTNASRVTRSRLADTHEFRRILHSLSRRPPALVGGFSTGLYLFAKMLSAAGRTVPAKACWSGGNTLADHHRPAIEAAFDSEVYQRYACEEMGSLAHECPEGRSLHVAGEVVIAEVVRADGQPAATGELGHVLLTSLRNEAMPLIRYRIGDVAVAAGDARCVCGRGLPILGTLIGRSNDMLVKGDGSMLLPGFVTEFIRDRLESVLEYLVLQHSDLRIDVSVVQRDEPSPDRVRREIASGLDELIGLPGATTVERVDQIPLAGAEKLRHVVSHAPLHRERP
jgi:phenylacetate-coenzyme A ligase PaaK-like adenylate-forming protein